MLEKSIQVKLSWPFPAPGSETLPLACFPLFLGQTKHCFFIANGEELCNEKQHALHIQGWLNVFLCSRFDAD